MLEAVKEFEYDHGVTVEIVPDEDGYASNPRDNDNLAVIADFDPREQFGDEHISHHEEMGWSVYCPRCDGNGYLDDDDDESCPHCEGTGYVEGTCVEWVKQARDAIVAVPLRYSDYGSSGARIHVTDDAEDANGVAYVTRERCETLGVTIDDEEIKRQIGNEIDEMNSWLSGEVYGIVVRDADGEVTDSVWGFIGDPFETDSYIVSEAESLGEYASEQAAEAPAEFEIVVRVKLDRHLDRDARASAAEAFRSGIVKSMSTPKEWRYGVVDVAEVEARVTRPKGS